MSQNLQNIAKFQNFKFQFENLVDFEKCCKTHIFLQKSEPIQPKTSSISKWAGRNRAGGGRAHPGHGPGPEQERDNGNLPGGAQPAETRTHILSKPDSRTELPSHPARILPESMRIRKFEEFSEFLTCSENSEEEEELAK